MTITRKILICIQYKIKYTLKMILTIDYFHHLKNANIRLIFHQLKKHTNKLYWQSDPPNAFM